MSMVVCLAWRGAEAATRVSQGAFTSAGKPIRYKWYHPDRSGRAPAVILLHGSGGVGGNTAWMAHYGDTLARSGYNVLAVHYMERTGHTCVADIPTMRTHFRKWLQVVTDSITFIGRRPGVDARRIGVLGLSLGAYLGISTATTDRRVKAVVEYFGGLPGELRTARGRLAPILVLHGTSDRVVPVDEAFSLMGYLDAIKSPYESGIYPSEGHGFSKAAQLDSETRTLRFLHRHLGK